jgi:DNA helicase-2/ATP-dependent DNA helicase PcrA
MTVIPEYLRGLDPDQQKLAMAVNGPVRGVAGAGSGKTTTLTHRIAYMVKDCGISPTEIMVNTFTKKASNEMKDRLKKLIKKYELGFELSDMTMGTMHSIACQVAKYYGSAIDLKTNFTILDQDDAESILDKLVKKFCGKDMKLKSGVLMGSISYAKNAGADLKMVLGDKMSSYSSMHSLFCQVADAYERKKKEMNTMDFDDLLLTWLQIIEESPKALAHMQDRWKYVMIDEYQDTNNLQDRIMNRICEKNKNIFVVGDDKQSIYAFRAANVENILTFDNIWPGCETIHLGTNYRSTPQIIGAANALILNNTRQLHQPTKTPNKDGQKPVIIYPHSDRDQNEEIVKYIKHFLGRGLPADQIAVLYRNNRQPIMLEKDLARARIPYYKKGARFWQSAHLKLAISWLKMLHNPLDKPALSRIISIYPGLGDKAVETATELIKTEEDFTTFISGGFKELPLVKKGERSSWAICQDDIKKMVDAYEAADDDKRVPEAALYLKALLGDYVSQSWPDNATDRMEDFDVLADLGSEFTTAGELLDEISLQDERSGEAKKKVLLSTVHGVKGLEFQVVIIMGMNEGVFPGRFAVTDADMQEERRLFYVAMTRAKQILIMLSPLHIWSYGGRDLVPANKSMFLDEIPEEFLHAS